MDPWDRRRDDDRRRDQRERDQRERDQRERDQRERDRLERDRLAREELDDAWAGYVADRVAGDAADAARFGELMAADRARIVREQEAAARQGDRLQVWPESRTQLPSAVQFLDPLDLATYGWMDWRHPTVTDLHARLLGRLHPADGGDLALVCPRVPQGVQLVAREQVPEEWTWVTIERVSYPLAVRADRGLILLSWLDPAAIGGRG